MKTINLHNQKYIIENYGTLCAMIKVTINNTDYELMFDLNKSKNGLDETGSHACVNGLAIVISNYPEPKVNYPKIEINDIIDTPMGKYILTEEFNFRKEYKLTEIQ